MSIRSARLVRYALVSGGLLVILLLVLLTMLSLTIYTQAGSRWVTRTLIERVNSIDGITLQSSGVTGNLLSGLTLTDLVIEMPAANIKANSLRASWNPYSVLTGSFYLSELNITQLSVALPATPSDPESEPADAIALLRLQPLPINLAIADLNVSDMTLDMSGQSYRIEQLRLSAALDGQQLSVQDLHVAAAGIALDLNLEAQLRDNIPLLASLNWEYQGSFLVDSGIGNYELAVGSAAITGDLTLLEVQHELLAPEAIHSTGRIEQPLQPADLSLDFTHSTESLRLPYAVVTDFLFENVALATRWNGADLDLELLSDVSSMLLPTSQLAATGILGTGNLALPQVNLNTPTGALTLSGALSWADQFQSEFTFGLSEQAPLQYLPESVPVDLIDIDVAGSLTFGFENDVRMISLEVDEFSGTSSGYALTAESSIKVVGDAVQIQNFRLNTVANEILITGVFDEQIELDWQLRVPELGQLLNGIDGAVSGSGKITGAIDDPGITAILRMQQLQSGTVTVDSVDISIAGTLEQLRSDIQVADARLDSAADVSVIDLLQLQFEGSQTAHTLTSSLESRYGSLDVVLQGGIADINALEWVGAINQAQLRSEFGNWTKQPASTPLTLSPASIQIPETCWQLETTAVCVAAIQGNQGQLQFDASVSNFPLQEFNLETAAGTPLISHPAFPRLPQGLGLEGAVSATITGLLDPANAPPRVEFSLIANSAVLAIASTETVDAAIANELMTVQNQFYNWDTLAVQGEWNANTWTLSGDAALSQQNVGNSNLGLRGEINSNLSIDPVGNLNGATTIRFAELGWIQAFVPDLTEVRGSLEGEIDIAGTLREPLITGQMSLENGAAEVARTGISLTDVRATVSAQSNGTVDITGALNSAEGNISFNGNITDLYGDSRRLEATLNGSNFLLANLPDAKLEVSPELSLSANSALIQLNGTLDVPVLDLTLQELPETAVDISRDVVIVAYPEDQPELSRSFAARQSSLFDIPIAADVNLTLGDEVAISGFGMQATLDGDLSIQQRVDGRNLTYGELSIVEGSYTMYGQTLTLNQGKLLFFGAIDNPALDIRAIREVEGMTVGVLMNGTLKNIRSQLFSTPVLPDNDIIAVLVTGRPYSEMGQQDGTAVLGAIARLGLERGEGLTDQIRNTLGLDTLAINSTGNINSSALTIGKYLTPDIFIRYGVGLFDRQSKVAIDYTLTERIMLQAESGEYQSIDLTYKVER